MPKQDGKSDSHQRFDKLGIFQKADNSAKSPPPVAGRTEIYLPLIRIAAVMDAICNLRGVHLQPHRQFSSAGGYIEVRVKGACLVMPYPELPLETPRPCLCLAVFLGLLVCTGLCLDEALSQTPAGDAVSLSLACLPQLRGLRRHLEGTYQFVF